MNAKAMPAPHRTWHNGVLAPAGLLAFVMLFATGPLLFAEEEPPGNPLLQVIEYDDGGANKHLAKAEDLLIDAENAVERPQMLALMREAILEILRGLQQVYPYDMDNEQALRLQRHLLDVAGETGLEKVETEKRAEYSALLRAAEAGDCEQSERLVAEILAAVPEFLYAHIVLGDCCYQNRDFKTALEHYALAAKKDPNYARAYTRMAECYDYLEQPNEALAHYIQAVTLNPGSQALISSLKTYAYGNDYKVLLDRAPRMSRVRINEDGELKIAVRRSIADKPDVSAAWFSFGLKKYMRYVDHFKKDPSRPFMPSPESELEAFEVLIQVWEELQAEDPKLHDEDLDFLVELKKDELLEAFVYVRYFRPEFSQSYAKWRSDHADQVRKLFEKHLVVTDPAQVSYRDGMRLFAASQYREALEALEQAASGFVKGRDPDNKKSLAQCLKFMGRCARILGRTQEAVAYHEAARDFFGELRYEEGQTSLLNSLGLTYMILGRFDDAEQSFGESLALSRKRRDVDAEISVSVSIANLHMARGNVEAAYAVSNACLDLATNQPQELPLGHIYSNLGATSGERGDFSQAQDYYKTALAEARKWKDQRLEITVLSNLGNLLNQIGDWPAAERSLQLALSKARTLNDKDAEGGTLNNLSGVEFQRGRFREALDYQLDALELRREIGNLDGEAICLLSLGGLSERLGLVKDAQEYWESALRLAQKLKSRSLEATARSNLASIEDDPVAGLKQLQRALGAALGHEFTPTVNNPYPDPEIAELVGQSHQLRVIFANKGYFLRQIAQQAHTEQDSQRELAYLSMAQRALELSVELIESSRGGLEKSEQRITFLESRIGAYETMVAVLMRMEQLDTRGGWAAEAFRYSERGKSRTLAELLRQSQAKKIAGVPDEQLNREKQLELQIGTLQSALTKETDAEVRERLEAELGEHLADLEKFQKQLKAEYPRYAAVKYPEPASIDQVQMLLDDESALLEYFFGDDLIACWAITKDSTAAIVVEDPAAISQRVHKYRLALATQKFSFQPRDRLQQPPDRERQHPLAIGHDLFEKLVSPLLERVGPVKHLVIVPDGPLHQLPFETLVADLQNDSASYLLEKHSVSYIQSATVLASVKSSAPRRKFPQRIYAMGQPRYDRERVSAPTIQPSEEEFLRLARSGSVEDRLEDLLFVLGASDRPLHDLPGAGVEVDAIGELLNSTDFVFKKDDASEDRLKEYSRRGHLRDFQYLHFAAHGLVPDAAPGLACIVLAQDDDPGEDGLLTVGEVYGLELDCDLVTLSACKLGLGGNVRGEGVMGLTRAFLYAGSRGAVVSLWSIDDNATLALMEEFYTNLAKGDGKLKALRQAQLTMMRHYDPLSQRINRDPKPKTPVQIGSLRLLDETDRPLRVAPYYWAAFVLSGDWR